MKLARLIAVAIIALLVGAAIAQDYKPKSGEVIMKLAIEGRGNVSIRLFTKEAPNTTSRIMELARQGFYNGLKFHRVIKTPRPYLVQFGAPGSRDKSIDDPELQTQGTGKSVAYEESGQKNDAEGIVGLSAQPGDRNSGDCQFHILLAPAKFLDGNYTVFGKVVAGMDVVKKIEKGDKVISVTIISG